MDLPCERIALSPDRWIGSGGIGHVFAAVHEHMAQEVAMKILSPESASDPQLVARFLQEARALTHLQHPGVVRACIATSSRTVRPSSRWSTSTA